MEERLQKYMASCGVASRRKCEEFILEGRVKVNGIIVNELGKKVLVDKDIIEFDGVKIDKEDKKVYYILNKPTGVITSASDERGRKTVIDIVKSKERIFPIGRLDYNTSGLLLLTNDGEIFNKIMHPRVELFKTYIADVKGYITDKDIEQLKNGIDIGGYITAKAKVFIQKRDDNRSTIRISISEGKNRQIRRMCSKINHDVINLKRISIGDIKLGELKIGEYRKLNDKELNFLFRL
ncbi:Ribosomal large subunit pseudouridine synthase B [Clostridium bornimense]|uniref:Pseudouridine synthase n=1 Tax=Clostridium bornimense TaxID=1216932 RepID=W6RXL6_9CLOT|nr:pseudouridine synthase [Clostridium bornimense]CDM68374.1 Ribosomal large subunit pseudouridine synthase B [Clostridium bornimense]